jgi:hypothetical protein
MTSGCIELDALPPPRAIPTLGGEEMRGDVSDAPKLRLLDRVPAAIRGRHYRRRTEHAYVAWVRRFILFHGKRHPVELGAALHAGAQPGPSGVRSPADRPGSADRAIPTAAERRRGGNNGSDATSGDDDRPASSCETASHDRFVRMPVGRIVVRLTAVSRARVGGSR